MIYPKTERFDKWFETEIHKLYGVFGPLVRPWYEQVLKVVDEVGRLPPRSGWLGWLARNSLPKSPQLNTPRVYSIQASYDSPFRRKCVGDWNDDSPVPSQSCRSFGNIIAMAMGTLPPIYNNIYIYCAFLMRLLGFENMGFCVPNGETLNWNNWNDHPG